MTAPSSADLLAAHRWQRDRVAEALVGASEAAPDSSPLTRTGLLTGPLVAVLVALGAVWGGVVQEWFGALLAGRA